MIDDATDATAAWIEEGSVVEGFRVGRLLGAGGMGQVYEAEQLALRRIVAFKLIELPAAGADALARFEREVRAAARVSHRNVVQIHECGRCLVAGRSFGWIAMEYVADAQPIHAAPPPDSWRELVAQWIEPINAGLLACHQKGVIHRDVKPSNLLVGADGEVKLIDFGVARLEDATGADRLTRTGMQPGTRAWMSPEQLEGHDVDLRTDVYSLGLVVGEILSGEEIEGLRVRAGGPFTGLPRAFRRRHPALPSATAKDLGLIVEKAAEWRRELRYASLADLGADLRRVLEGRPVLAARPTLWRSASRFASRHKVVASVGALLFSVLAAWLISSNLSRHELWIERRSGLLARIVLLMSGMETRQAGGPAGQEWLEAALADMDELRGDRPRLQQDLEDVRCRGRHRPPRWSDTDLITDALPVEGVWEYDSPSDKYMDGVLVTALVWLDTLLEHFEPVLKARLTLADQERSETIESDAARAGWLRVVQDLRDGAEPYGSLMLEPQCGLVPVGRDARSRCFEFVVWGTGSIPGRDAAGRLIETDDTAIVVVLVPASSDAVGTPAAFFIARSPLTPAQWKRIGGTEGEPVAFQDSAGQARNLIAGVRRTECAALLPSWRLELPTEAQWRRAAALDAAPDGQILSHFGLEGLGAKAWDWTADGAPAASDSAEDVREAMSTGIVARYRPAKADAPGTIVVERCGILQRKAQVGVRPALALAPEPVRAR